MIVLFVWVTEFSGHAVEQADTFHRVCVHFLVEDALLFQQLNVFPCKDPIFTSDKIYITPQLCVRCDANTSFEVVQYFRSSGG